MKRLFNFIVASLVAGLLIVAPLYLAILLMLKAAASLGRLVKPFAGLLPEWLPAERLLSILLVLLICFFIGAAARTRSGRALMRSSSFVLRAHLGVRGHQKPTQRLAGRVMRLSGSRRLSRSRTPWFGFIIEDSMMAAHVLRPSARRRLPERSTCSIGNGVPGRPVHPGDQIRLSLGLGVQELVASMQRWRVFPRAWA